MWKDFKAFALKGNVVDMAVGIVIGTAFGKIVSSLVSDVIMPPVGKLVGGVDFTNLFLVLGEGRYATLEEAKEAGAATVNYGLFAGTVLDFLIIAFSIFFVVRQLRRLERKQPGPAPQPTTRTCPFCISTIQAEAVRCPFCTSELQAA